MAIHIPNKRGIHPISVAHVAYIKYSIRLMQMRNAYNAPYGVERKQLITASHIHGKRARNL